MFLNYLWIFGQHSGRRSSRNSVTTVTHGNGDKCQSEHLWWGMEEHVADVLLILGLNRRLTVEIIIQPFKLYRTRWNILQDLIHHRFVSCNLFPSHKMTLPGLLLTYNWILQPFQITCVSRGYNHLEQQTVLGTNQHIPILHRRQSSTLRVVCAERTGCLKFRCRYVVSGCCS